MSGEKLICSNGCLEEQSGPIANVDVPRILFEVVSERLGVGERMEVVSRGYSYLMQKIDPTHPRVGFEGAIGFKQYSETSSAFVLWLEVPEGEDNVFEPDPYLKVWAGEEESGEWAFGQGEKMHEACKAKVGYAYYDMNLRHPAAMFLIPAIISKAAQLASGAASESFWQVDKVPGEYESP